MEGFKRDLLQRNTTCCSIMRSTRASLLFAVSTSGSCVLLQAVLVNQGWECKGASDKAITARLSKIPMSKLCPIGFIFIWVDKTLVSLHPDLCSTSPCSLISFVQYTSSHMCSSSSCPRASAYIPLFKGLQFSLSGCVRILGVMSL